MSDEREQPDLGPSTDPDRHIADDEPVGVDDEELETESQSEGGPAGA